MNLTRGGSNGIPLCVAATKVDGLVLSLTPYSHSFNYRSVTLHGNATLVDDPAEKLYAMELLTNSVVPERWVNTRIPPDESDMSSTSILRMKVTSASAKIRTGPPSDAKKDIERPGLRERVWTGVVPVFETLGTPVPGPDNLVAEVPEHIGGFVEKMNLSTRMHAEGAAGVEKGN